MEPTAEYLDFDAQLTLFESRGMKILNRDKAKSKLENIGYYKLKEFAYPLATIPKRNECHEVDFSKVNFDDVVTRYYQDKNLRLFLLHAIEKIEVSIKTKFSYVLGKKYGAFGYLNFSKWCGDKMLTKEERRKAEIDFHKEILKKIKRSSSLDMKDTSNLSDGFPSVWLLVDVLTFGDIVYLLKMMSRKNVIEIADFYDCDYAELLSWLSCLNFVRNICAHNSNILDVKFKTTPKLKDSWKNYLYQHSDRGEYTNRIAVVFYIVKHLIDRINPTYRFTSITTSLDLIIKNNDTKAQILGFKNAEVFSNSLPMKFRKKKNYKKRKKRE